MPLHPDQSFNEDIRRLELLDAYDIMDTAPEPEFDDIVAIASEVCQTPVALISLIERERQWFKARIGFDPCETPIEQSVCALSLSNPDLLVIADLAADARTHHNTLVTQDPHIRFYAGAPLVGRDNIIIGSLCVIDTAPRPEGLSDTQRKVLSALSRQVVAHLQNRDLAHRKDKLFRRQRGVSSTLRDGVLKALAAQEAGRVGTFEVDIKTQTLKASPEFCRIFDVVPATSYPADMFENMVVEEDRGKQSSAETRADGSAHMNVEYRIRTARHGVRWVSRNAKLGYDDEGRPQHMLGIVQDITDTKRALLRTQALVDLGDRLHDLETIDDIVVAASDLMGQALDASRAGFGIVDPVGETVDMKPEWCAPGVASIAGIHRFRDYGSFIDDLKHGLPVVIADVEADARTSANATALLEIGIRVLVNLPIFERGRFMLVAFVHHDIPHVWTDDELTFVRSFGNRIQNAIARLVAEADQITLNREIGHRLKNTFAMIQAIASQTLRPVSERDHVQSFEKRLLALSKAHDILLSEQAGTTLAAIAKSMVDTISLPHRVRVSGPDIMLGPRGALSLSLLLHELGTNAVKYGALSDEKGIVAIDWWIDDTGAEPLVTLSWTETDGPAPLLPEKLGFGSRLIRLGMIGAGGVSLSYDPPGFSATMSASLHQLQYME